MSDKVTFQAKLDAAMALVDQHDNSGGSGDMGVRLCIDCGRVRRKALVLPRSQTCHDCAWRSLEANRRWAAAMERDALMGWV